MSIYLKHNISFCFREAEKEILGREDDEDMLDGVKEDSDSTDTEYTDSEEDTGNKCVYLFVPYLYCLFFKFIWCTAYLRCILR